MVLKTTVLAMPLLFQSFGQGWVLCVLFGTTSNCSGGAKLDMVFLLHPGISTNQSFVRFDNPPAAQRAFVKNRRCTPNETSVGQHESIPVHGEWQRLAAMLARVVSQKCEPLNVGRLRTNHFLGGNEQTACSE